MNPNLPQAIRPGLRHRLILDATAAEWERLDHLVRWFCPADIQIRNARQQPPHRAEWRWRPVVRLTVACRTAPLKDLLAARFGGRPA